MGREHEEFSSIKRDSTLRVRMPADLKEFLSRYAAEHDTTMSALIVEYVSNLRRSSSSVPQI